VRDGTFNLCLVRFHGFRSKIGIGNRILNNEFAFLHTNPCALFQVNRKEREEKEVDWIEMPI